jgi:hypothetical protein
MCSAYFAGLKNVYLLCRVFAGRGDTSYAIPDNITTIQQYLGLPFAGHVKTTVDNGIDMAIRGRDENGICHKVTMTLRTISKCPLTVNF